MDKISENEAVKGSTSDGYHTFDELYHHRTVLFSIICKLNPACSWKSKKHFDGTMYHGMFIAGITTPLGDATYHVEEEEWELFDGVAELEHAPEFDGHTPEDALYRLLHMQTKTDC
jgi:hypothetical protein